MQNTHRTAQEHFDLWRNSPALNPDEKAELESIAADPKEIESRFFAPLDFGTAGLRGTMKVGLHHMNRHVVSHITQAFANLILKEGGGVVAVCYDSRNNSPEFAEIAASVLAGNGIHVKLFSDCRPTPELSFVIREHGCIAGINITASHNPKEYNGYKVYWSDGAQLPPEHAGVVAREADILPMFQGVLTTNYQSAVESGKIELLDDKTDRDFLDAVLCQSITQEYIQKVADDIKIVFTPFHGTGYKLVPQALARLGFKHVIGVPSQMIPDGNFPTVKSPNPEDKEGFALAVELATQENADLIIGTDPDADRIGALVLDSGEYKILSGNQMGVLLLDYIIRARKEKGSLPPNAATLKSIVSSEMPAAIAAQNGVASFDTFTGFKFLAEKIKQFEETGSHRYIFAFEESYGYLAGDHARDKDAVTAAVLIAEMAAYYKAHNKTLLYALQELYALYGTYTESTINLAFPGLDGLRTMESLMKRLRETPPTEIIGTRVTGITDYLPGTLRSGAGKVTQLELKGSNVLSFDLQDGTQIIVRPSGTEPKIKVYIKTRGKNQTDADRKINAFTAFAKSLQEG